MLVSPSPEAAATGKATQALRSLVDFFKQDISKGVNCNGSTAAAAAAAASVLGDPEQATLLGQELWPKWIRGDC